MNNFNAFDEESIRRVIEPFAKGMSEHIVPIKFEAITPDIFAFLFRTTGKNVDSDYVEHYFVVLEFDYIESAQEAERLIEDWHGANIIEFWSPEGADDDDAPVVEVDNAYKIVLAKVERPKGNGYWATNEVILSPEGIDAFVAELDKTQRTEAKKSLSKIFSDYPEVSVSVYVHPDGKIEYFFG